MTSIVAVSLALLVLNAGLAAPSVTPFLLTFVALLVTSSILILLHSPHDVVEAVAAPARASPREPVYVIGRHNLLEGSTKGSWKRLHKGLGPHKLSALMLSPEFAVDSTMFVGSLGGGVYRSEDGGRSWAQASACPSDPFVIALAISPRFAKDGWLVALGRRGGLFQTRDRGETWEPLASPEDCDNSIGECSPTSSEAAILDPMVDAGVNWRQTHQLGPISCIAIALDGLLVACSGSVFWSKDHGESWTRLAQSPGRDRVTCLEVPSGGLIRNAVFAGTESHGVFRILDGRASAGGCSRKSPRHVTSLASSRDRGGDLVLLATSWNRALFRSSDRGMTWEVHEDGLARDPQADERRFGAPHFTSIAVQDSQPPTSTTWVGGFNGLFHSSGETREWVPVPTLPLGIVVGLDVAPTTGSDVVIAATTYGAGVYLLRWPASPGKWEIRNRGLQTMRLGVVAFSPCYPVDQAVFAACEGHVLRSSNGGLDWNPVPLSPGGVAEGVLPAISSFLRSAERRLSERLDRRAVLKLRAAYKESVKRAGLRANYFVFPTAFAFSPSYQRDGALFVGTRAHGVFRSDSGGRGFTRVWDGAGGGFVFSLATLPLSSQRFLLFAALSEGLYRSSDAGVSWRRIGPDRVMGRARLATSSTGALFAGTSSGLLRSDDCGDSWVSCPLLGAGGDPPIDCLKTLPSSESDQTLAVNALGAGIFLSTHQDRGFRRLELLVGETEPSFSQWTCFPDAAGLLCPSPHYLRDGRIFAAAGERVLSIDSRTGSAAVLEKPTRYEDVRSEVEYHGRWTRVSSLGFSASGAHRTKQEGASCRLRFTGSGIVWIGTRGPDHGVAEILIDGEPRQTLDLRADEPESNCTLVGFHALEPGGHEICIRVIGRGSGLARNGVVAVDAFDVYD